MRGKEPLHSRKIHLGSSPPTRVKSPKRRRPGLSFDSSSDEETARSVRRNTPKLDNVQQVVAQIHFPRGEAKPEIVEHHTSSQGESSVEESSKDVLVAPKKHQEQCSSSLAKPRSIGESRSFSATTRHGNGSMTAESKQIEKIDESSARCDELNEKESITFDQQEKEDLTTVKTSENTKPGASEHENDKPQDDDTFSTEEREKHADDVEHVQCVSKVEDSDEKGLEKPTLSEQPENDGVKLEENGAVKPLENGKHSEDAEPSGSLNNSEDVKNNTVPTTEQLDSSAKKNEVENSALIMKEDSSVVKSLENGHHPESAQSSGSLCPSAEAESNTRPELDQLGGNTEKNVGKEDTGKVEGERYASLLTGSAPTVKQDFIEDDRELFLEGDSNSECSSHSKASESKNQSTPFENDTSDESNSNDSIHTCDSFNSIEDEGKTKVSQRKAISSDGAFAASMSAPNGGISKQQQREGSGKEASKIRSSPELGFRTMVPVIEDEGIRSLGHDESDRRNSCQTCPARQSCLETDDKRKQDVPRQGANDDKQSTVLQQRPSAPVKIPAPQNRLLAKLRDTASGSVGSKWSECGSLVSAVGSIPSGKSVESFHTARSGGSALQSPGASSNDGSDHNSESNHSSDDKRHVLPISSSFVDVICAVNRVTAFACHLCEILCPDETSQSVEHAATAFPTSADEDLKNESLAIKRRLYHKLIQVLIIP